MLRKSVLTGIFSILMAQAAIAGDLVDMATKAEAALKTGKNQEAVSLMRSAVIAAWKIAPLSIEEALFVSEPGRGYGLYNRRPNAAFGQGEPILIYLEPVGFTWVEENGLYRSHIIADFEILSPDGRVLAGQKDFGAFKFVSHEQNTEYMANMTLTLSGAPQGKYIAQITLRDQFNNDQSASVRLPFEMK